MVLIGGLDSTDFGERSIKDRGFGTGEGDFGTGDDGFCRGEGEPESHLMDPFLATLLTLGVAVVVMPFEDSDRPDLLSGQIQHALLTSRLQIHHMK